MPTRPYNIFTASYNENILISWLLHSLSIVYNIVNIVIAYMSDGDQDYIVESDA